MSHLTLEIVTPTGTAFAGRAASVQLPGSLGELGILPGHLALVTTLKPGAVIAEAEGGARGFAVGYGFAEVSDDVVRVLVDACVGADAIDIENAKTALAALEAALDKDAFASKEELDEATREAARTRARLSIIEHATKGK